MARIPAEELEAIKRSVDIVALVRAKGVELKKHGEDYIGLCPFHDDKNPSLVVSPKKNLWHCLGACDCGGDGIEWITRTEGLSFRHAVEVLKNGNGSSLLSTNKIIKQKTVRPLPCPLDPDADDATLLSKVIDYYQERLQENPAALDYLTSRGINNPEAISTFSIGFADRTLGLRIPPANRKAGKELRERLIKLGILRKSGHEHFNGCIVFPVMNEEGVITEIYGRKINDNLRPGTVYHLYLPGPHRGMWNPKSLTSENIIVCESIIDALTFWVNGYRNVTASYGTGGFTDEMLDMFLSHGVKTVYLAYDRDVAGDTAAEKLAKKLLSEGLSCFRVTFPHTMDANEYALKVTQAGQSLSVLLKSALWMGNGSKPHPIPSIDEGQTKESQSDGAADLTGLAAGPSVEMKIPASLPEKRDEEPKQSIEAIHRGPAVEIKIGDRHYRILNLKKNKTFGVMKINIRLMFNNQFHVDTVDLYSHRLRNQFVETAAAELSLSQKTIKRDLGRILLKLEELQEKQIAAAMEPKKKDIVLTPQERKDALDFLTNPNMLETIVDDFERCGLVGERVNKLVGYLASVSRKLEHPLGIIIQSSSSAGKSFLMESLLTFMPAEEWQKYSAMTGQSLYYLGENDLKYKILAIVEEEGAQKATYPLKLLQSEGELTIASTGKDPATGKLFTQTYRIEGPVVVLISTTNIEIDEELQNRCIVLTVNEDRDQTRAIHQLQRKLRTLEGFHLRQEWDHIRTVHRNAQRMLRPLLVINPYAPWLTFLDVKTRTRRDHIKYLTLIESIALLHQYQRDIKIDVFNGVRTQYIEVTLEDIELANKLASDVLGRSLDELPPQTRRMLNMIYDMVRKHCDEKQIDQMDYRFTRKTVRDFTGWGNTQVKVHLHRLEEMEYILVHQGQRGRQFVYELLYRGEGQDGSPFLMGLLDVEKLRSQEVSV